MADELPIPGKVGKSWSPYDEVTAKVADDRKKQTGLSEDDIALHYAKTFSSKSGRIVFDDLMRFAFSHDGFNPALGFFDGAAFGFYRQGMGDLVSFIHRKRHRQPKE